MKRVMIVLMFSSAIFLTETRYANAQSLLIREITPESLLGTTATNISGDLIGGGKFNLADYRGKKIVILDFWATWCGPCRMTLPILVKASQDYKEKDVVLFGINAGEDPGTISAFQEEAKLSFNVVLDPYGEISNEYGVHSLPFSVIINKKGIIEAVHLGASMQFEEILKKELDTLVEGKSLLNPTTTPSEPSQTTQNPSKDASTSPVTPDNTQPPVKDPPTIQAVQKAETLPEPPVSTAPASKPDVPVPPQTETTTPNTFPLSPEQVKTVNVLSPRYMIAALITALVIIGLVWAVINGLRGAGKNKSNTEKKEG